MTTQDLQFVAEALLELCDNDRRSTHFVERRAATVSLDLDDTAIYQAVLRGRRHDPLLESECQEIYDRAKLTTRQSKVLEMRLRGLTFEEIGRRRGHTKQGAQSIFLQAIKKLARALRVYPYTGLAEVYRHETHRGARQGGFGTIHR